MFRPLFRPPMTMHDILRTVGIGLVMGLVYGAAGYLARDYDPERGAWEGFEPAKLGRTLVIYGAAGALVGLWGDPLTQDNIVAATGSTVMLGELAERLIKRAMKQREIGSARPSSMSS